MTNAYTAKRTTIKSLVRAYLRRDITLQEYALAIPSIAENEEWLFAAITEEVEAYFEEQKKGTE